MESTDNVLCKETEPFDMSRAVAQVCITARKGLSQCYRDPINHLPYTTRLSNDNKLISIGNSVRYAAICQIGIQRWIRYHPEDISALPDLWPALTDRLSVIDDIGDAALCLWAAADAQNQQAECCAELLQSLWPHRRHTCNAVELGWIVKAGIVSNVKGGRILAEKIKPILDSSYQDLRSLYAHDIALFRRHNRRGRFNISRNISCFADQVYPILALAAYGAVFDDAESIQCASAVVNSICSFQGPLGQWMWHYDTNAGKVCEEYPVFSVHQDAMAPMAILAADKVAGTDHTADVQRGMRWLLGKNELNKNLILPDKGIIWRDIERREPFKFSRLSRGICCALQLEKCHHLLRKSILGYKLNYECRPYHLGWILYAWADYKVTSQRGV